MEVASSIAAGEDHGTAPTTIGEYEVTDVGHESFPRAEVSPFGLENDDRIAEVGMSEESGPSIVVTSASHNEKLLNGEEFHSIMGSSSAATITDQNGDRAMSSTQPSPYGDQAIGNNATLMGNGSSVALGSSHEGGGSSQHLAIHDNVDSISSFDTGQMPSVASGSANTSQGLAEATFGNEFMDEMSVVESSNAETIRSNNKQFEITPSASPIESAQPSNASTGMVLEASGTLGAQLSSDYVPSEARVTQNRAGADPAGVVSFPPSAIVDISPTASVQLVSSNASQAVETVPPCSQPPPLSAERMTPVESFVGASALKRPSSPTADEIIELLEVGSSTDEADQNGTDKRRRAPEDDLVLQPAPKKVAPPIQPPLTASTMTKTVSQLASAPLSSNGSYMAAATVTPQMQAYGVQNSAVIPAAPPNPSTVGGGRYYFDRPFYLPPSIGFTPKWKQMTATEYVPYNPAVPYVSERRYQLTLLNVSEFTITGLAVRFEGDRTSLNGLRKDIKTISRPFGKAVYEKDAEHDEGGKWRIPLAAYQNFFAWLSHQPNTYVEPIPTNQLQIASLGRARLEKGYPGPDKILSFGVPKTLAEALAPFQRGGVDFVHDKGGRALIADEMGLGKTIQAIASMAIYHTEWPILILSPSGARYHWENEFLQWLGETKNSAQHAKSFAQERNNQNPVTREHRPVSNVRPMDTLKPHQVNVLTSSKDPLFPRRDTKVVICSYGLAPGLAKSGVIAPGLFKCAIVDESHMLKNKKSLRTKSLMPVLQNTTRCVLLSGTPAFARPMELWPQLVILGTERHGWGTDESDFVRKYVKGAKHHRAELHAMLTGTVMIRRLKNDILKTLPKKHRELATVNLLDDEAKVEFQQRIERLRSGKGTLSKIAKTVTALAANSSATLCFRPGTMDPGPKTRTEDAKAAPTTEMMKQATAEMNDRYQRGLQSIQYGLQTNQHSLTGPALDSFVADMRRQLEQECKVFYTERLAQLQSPNTTQQDYEKRERKSALTELYKMTGQVKVPVVLDMLQKWLANPAMGKLCIFAHHLSVLDALQKQSELSNATGSNKKFIRIDGSTGPKVRQQQINAFQNDPSYRIALLGITAAGVAVTLTASSTVWFAEMFWTPALMIQAEDRCHRIGQQARVRCLYLVAKGTLDEILWKHVEKKFQDLGEFVEGKEKMKIVCNKKFKNYNELKATLELDETLSDDEDDDAPEDVIGADVDDDLLHEIEELAEEEVAMLRGVENEDGDDGEGDVRPVITPRKRATPVAGSSEAEAICLSDDEEPPTKVTSGNSDFLEIFDAVDSTYQRPLTETEFIDKTFSDLRQYKMHFPGPSYGLEIVTFHDRVIVRDVAPARKQQFGSHVKPHIGDVLLAVNGQPIPLGYSFGSLKNHLSASMRNPPVELTFAEHPIMTKFFTSYDFNQLGSGQAPIARVSLESEFPIMSEHRHMVTERRFGFDLLRHEGYLVASKKHEDGQDPRFGDVLVSVNNMVLPRHTEMQHAITLLTAAVKTPPVELIFKRSNRFSKYLRFLYDRNKARKRLARQQAAMAARQQAAQTGGAAGGSNEVIELLDD